LSSTFIDLEQLADIEVREEVSYTSMQGLFSDTCLSMKEPGTAGDYALTSIFKVQVNTLMFDL